MGSRRLAPEVKVQAAVMLEVGYSQQAVAEKLGISLNSVRRIRTTVIPGSKKGELKEAAFESLYQALDSDFTKQQICALIIDDLAFAKRLRSNLAQLLDDLERLPVTDHKSGGMKARAFTQAATANKLNSDSLRQVLALRENEPDLEELPVLEVREMLDSEIAELREKQEAEARALGVNKPK